MNRKTFDGVLDGTEIIQMIKGGRKYFLPLNSIGGGSPAGINAAITKAAPLMDRLTISNGKYDAWPSAVRIAANDTILSFWSSTDRHAGNCEARIVQLTKSGQVLRNEIFWTSLTRSRRDYGSFITSAGTLLVSYVEREKNGGVEGVAVGMGLWRSTDDGDSFTDIGVSAFPIPEGQLDYAAYGGFVQLPSGRILKILYGTNNSDRLWIVSSVDDGLTWSYYATVYSGGLQYSESDLVIVDAGVSDALTTLICVSRNDVGKMVSFRSFDGGLTWQPAVVIAFSQTASKAPQLKIIEGQLILTWTDRSASGECIRAAELDMQTVASWEGSYIDQALQKSKSYGNSTIVLKDGADPGSFGYSWLETFDGTKKGAYIFYYDCNANSDAPFGLNTDIMETDICAVPYEQRVFVSADLSVAQSLTNGVAHVMEFQAYHDTHGSFDGEEFLSPKTAMYHFYFNAPVSNIEGGRRITDIVCIDPTDGYENILYSKEEQPGLASGVGTLNAQWIGLVPKGFKVVVRCTSYGNGTPLTIAGGVTPASGSRYGLRIAEM